MVIGKEEIESFLAYLKNKLKIKELNFEARPENEECIAELNLNVLQVKKIISELEVSNYYKGPKDDKVRDGKYWEFGKLIKGKEVYIKINAELFNKNVICISFHFSKFEIKYKFK